MIISDSVFLNLGCYDGITNDPIYRYILQKNITGYFVDANKEVLKQCRINIGEEGHVFENIGIHYESGVHDFYVAQNIPNTPSWFTQTSTFRFDQVEQTCDRLGLSTSAYRVEQVVTETIEDFIINRKLNSIVIMNMDLEGLDKSVIVNFPFYYVKPKTIIIEIVNEGGVDEDIYNFLTLQGYTSDRKPVTNWSLIFKLKE